jgi:hypothetical protein
VKRDYLVALIVAGASAVVASPPAAAQPHKLLVLQAEGRADPAVRAKIDTAILRLARAAEPQTTAGELSFSDAATAVGCRPDSVACKDEVLGMLAVDEIVITTVTPRPGGLEIAVRRIGKGGASRDATMLLLAAAAPDKLDGIAPLFGAPPAPAGSIAPSPTGPRVAVDDRTREPPGIPAPAAVREPQPSPIVTPLEPVSLAEAPPSTRRHRLEIAGMAGGAGMVVLGAALWAAASGVQGEIEDAPTMTRKDLAHLKDLEAKGDGLAGLGNLLVIGGVIAGSLGTYFYIMDRRAASSASARLTPTVLDHGAGLVLTIGALR